MINKFSIKKFIAVLICFYGSLDSMELSFEAICIPMEIDGCQTEKFNKGMLDSRTESKSLVIEQIEEHKVSEFHFRKARQELFAHLLKSFSLGQNLSLISFLLREDPTLLTSYNPDGQKRGIKRKSEMDH